MQLRADVSSCMVVTVQDVPTPVQELHAGLPNGLHGTWHVGVGVGGVMSVGSGQLYGDCAVMGVVKSRTKVTMMAH